MATDKSGKGTQSKRDKKVSKGLHGGGGKVRLTPLQKALMGQGVMARYTGPLEKPKSRG